MKIIKFEDTATWLEAREGKITGTKILDITPLKRGIKDEPYGDKRAGWFTLLGELMSVNDGLNEKPMNRGNRLEDECIDEFIEMTGMELCKDKVMWQRDDNEHIAISPDAFTNDLKTAVEVKCLEKGKHAEALIKNKMPEEHRLQAIQYFVVNQDLKKLHVVLYNPTFIVNQLLTFVINRDEVQETISEYLEMERKVLEDMKVIVKKFIEEESCQTKK